MRPNQRPNQGLSESPSDDHREERGLVCVHCRNVVTHPSARLAVQGAHRHTFANPNGLVFLVGCYTEAPGCRPIGEPSSEFTWFAGYTWRVSSCTRCGMHLGWIFESAVESFYGLIVDRLEEDDTGQPLQQP